MSSASQAGSEVSILPPLHYFITRPQPTPEYKRPRQQENAPYTSWASGLKVLSSPGKKASSAPAKRGSRARTGPDHRESVLQHPRAASEVPPRRGSFRPGSPRFCPAGGRAPAAPPQPVRESRAARAPASPRPATPFPSLLSGLGRVLGEIVTSSALREAPFRREGEGEARPGPRGQLLPSELALGRGRTGIRPGFLDCS